MTQEQLEELRQKLAADLRSTQQGGNPPATSWSLTRGDQRYDVRDAAEAQRLFDEQDRQSRAALEAERIRAQALEQQLQGLQQQATPSAQQGQPTGPVEFDKEEYARLFLQDPRKAQQYMWQHDDQLKNFFSGLATKVVQLESDLENERQLRGAERFMSKNGDYVATADNFAVLESIMHEHNLPWTEASLGMAWTAAKEQGLVEVAEAQPAADEYVSVPSFGRTNTANVEGGDDVINEFERWSPEKQKAFLESLQTTTR